MEKRTSLKLEEKARKDIWVFRQFRKKKKKEEEDREKNTPKKVSPDLDDIMKRAVDIAFDEMCPTYKEYMAAMNNAADSAWFAMSELERFKDHMEELHGGKTDDCCGEGCLEDFTMEDAKEYMQTIMKHLEEYLQ